MRLDRHENRLCYDETGSHDCEHYPDEEGTREQWHSLKLKCNNIITVSESYVASVSHVYLSIESLDLVRWSRPRVSSKHTILQIPALVHTRQFVEMTSGSDLLFCGDIIATHLHSI